MPSIVNEFGVRLNTLSENIVEETERFLKYMGYTVPNASSASGEAVALTAEAKTRIEQFIAEAINSTTLDGALGTRLDKLAEIYGFKRKVETPSIGYVQVVGIDGTIIPVHTKFKRNGKPIYEYQTTHQVTIPASGKVSIEVESIKTQYGKE